MLKKRQQVSSFAIAILLLVSLFSCATGQKSTHEMKEEERDITQTNATRIVLEMTAGWNLGNTMDSLGGETAWGNPLATKDLIDTIARAGFNTLRLPVTWGQFTGPAPDYKLNQEQLARAREIIDWAISNKMYVILNMHHEDDWLIPRADEYEKVEEQFSRMWEQLAEYFKDYNDRLLFEGMNEPRVKGSAEEWIGGDAEGWEAINKLNQVFVNIVRNSGGNNQYRALLVTPYGANAIKGANNFIVPQGENLIISAHSYDPVKFTFFSDNDMDLTNWDGRFNQEIDYIFENLYETFVTKGYPVILTEFGSTTKEFTNKDGVKGSNEGEVIKWASYFIQRAKKSSIKTVWWDNGRDGLGDDRFALIDRNSYKIVKPDLVKAIIAAAKASPNTLLMEPEVTPKKIIAGGYVDEEGRAKSAFGTPIIDGVEDSEWDKTKWIIPGYKSGPGVKATAEVKVLWDNTTLYTLIKVLDSNLNKAHNDSWEQDSVEIFLDELNDKATSYKNDDIQFRIRYDNNFTGGQGDSSRLTSAIKEILDDNGNIAGYLLEVAIKFQKEQTKNTVMGFDVQINDAGSIGARMGTLNLFDDTNGTWNNPSKMGELILLN